MGGCSLFSRLKETTPGEGKNETPLKKKKHLPVWGFMSHQVSAKCLRKRSSVSTAAALSPLLSPAHRGGIIFPPFLAKKAFEGSCPW